MISGRGTNFNALLSATMDPAYPAEFAGVISNRADARGLKVAEDHGIKGYVIPHGDYENREEHEAAINDALRDIKAEIVCLAGYMRLLTASFVKKWQGKMINIHPSLLPSFKGLHTHARALEAGVRIHGCTVHFVTPEMDEGPVIIQAAVPVLADDTEETLAARVLEAEHVIYPRGLAMVADGTARMASGSIRYSGNEEPDDHQMLVSPGLRRKTRQT